MIHLTTDLMSGPHDVKSIQRGRRSSWRKTCPSATLFRNIQLAVSVWDSSSSKNKCRYIQ